MALTPRFQVGQKVIYHAGDNAYIGEIQGIIQGVIVSYEFRGTHYSRTRKHILIGEEYISHVYEGDAPVRVDSYRSESNPGEIKDEWADTPL